MARPIEEVPPGAQASALAAPGAAGLERLVASLDGPAREALEVLVARMDTPAGRRAATTLAWLIRLMVGVPPELLEGLERGLGAAAAVLGDPTPPRAADLWRLAGRPSVRRGAKALLALLAGLGGEV